MNDSVKSTQPAAAPYSGQPDDLHDLFQAQHAPEGETDDPLAAMRNDPNYAELIRELEYIAKQARELFGQEEETPSDAVWEKIQTKLAQE